MRLIDADKLVEAIYDTPLRYFGALHSYTSENRAKCNREYLFQLIDKMPTEKGKEKEDEKV